MFLIVINNVMIFSPHSTYQGKLRVHTHVHTHTHTHTQRLDVSLVVLRYGLLKDAVHCKVSADSKDTVIRSLLSGLFEERKGNGLM